MSELKNIKERLEKVEALAPPIYADFIESLRNDIRYLVDKIEEMEAQHKEEIDRITQSEDATPLTPHHLAMNIHKDSIALMLLLGMPHAEEVDLSFTDTVPLGEITPGLLSNQSN